MSILQGIKKTAGRYMAARMAAKSKTARKAVNFESAKKIGILYDATDMEKFEIVKQYAKNLRLRKKEVKALGFVNAKQTDRHQQPTIDLDFFTLNDVNWYYKPAGHIVNNFIHAKHDILICLDLDGCIPLQFISAVSSAGFRVGKYNKANQSFYDMMIDLQNNANLSYFIEQVNHYLEMINKN